MDDKNAGGQNMAISDVQLKNNYYQVIDENGKKIKEAHYSSVGELQGIGIDFIVFLKNHYHLKWGIVDSLC